MAGRSSFELDFARPEAAARPQRRLQSGQRRILVLGDFTGHGHYATGPEPTTPERATMVIDVDSFDAVLARCEPKVRLGANVTGGAEVELSFNHLDDFHPDHLYRSVDAFRLLRESRARLLDPAGFESEAASLLQPLLGAPAERAPRAPTPGSLVDGLVARLVQPHIVRGTDPSLATYLSALDASASELMRRILHDAEFQAQESLWRGVRRLVEQLDLGDQITISILDVAKQDLVPEAGGTERSRRRVADVQRLLHERGADRPDEPAWSLLAGCYQFSADRNDLTLLTDLGTLAADAGVPLLASATPSLMAGEEPDWSALRHSPVARWIGLAWPRMLLRLPYGKDTDAIESFPFDEFAGPADHESLLWGNPALACVEALARCILDDGNGAEPPGGGLELADLPAYVSTIDGEKRLQPGAEHLLSLQTGEDMLQRGFIPLLSFRDRNAVRILRMQSIADPATPLPGYA